MATKWIREVNSSSTGESTGLPFFLKCVAMFMRYCLGYTNPAENIQNRSGSNNASFTAGDTKTLSQGGIFDSSDVGKQFVVTNASDANNNGTYNIVAYFNRWQIQIYKAGSGGAENSSFDWQLNDTVGGPGTNSYWSFQKNGTNGEFNLTGSDKDFRDSTASSFVVGDVGKWIVIAGNAVNAGVYKITAFVSATTVTVDFRSGATEYPTAQTGLSWWVIDETDSTPVGEGDYFRLTTPHSHGWAVEVSYYDVIEVPAYTGRPRIGTRIAVDGNWGGSKILSKVWWGLDNGKTGWCYGAFDDSGEAIHIMAHNSTDNVCNGAFVCNIAPYDTGHSTTELVALMGNVSSTWGDADPGTGNLIHDIGGGVTLHRYVGHGYVWRDIVQTERDIYMIATTYSGWGNCLERWTSREKNRRRSGSGSGTGDSFSLTGTTITLTDAGAAFVASDVGKTIKIAGSTTPGNDGLFVITSWISATQITYENASGATEAFPGTWAIADFQDVIIGIPVIVDSNNDLNEYEIIGRLKGNYGVRENIGDRVAFNDSAPHALDKFHIFDGFAFDWPGVTPQH